MRVNFETRLKIFFVLIIVGIMGIAAFTYQYYQSVAQVNTDLAQSNQLHSVSQALLIDLQDLELSTRAYSLSADSNHLLQYEQAKHNLYSHLRQIHILTRSNAEFQRRLHTLSILINQKIRYTEKLIEVTDQEGVAGASELFKTSHASDLMQHMRFTIKSIQSKENHLLKERNRDYESEFLNLRYTYYALLVSLVAAVCVIGYFTIYQTRVRKIRERKLRERERQLDRRVKSSLKEIEKQYLALKEIAEIQSHQVRGPIATILGLINLLNFENPYDPNNVEILVKLKSATEVFDEVIEQIVNMTNEIERLQSNNRSQQL